MRKSHSSDDINNEQFDGLIKITSEMSKYLYPYIRAIVASGDNYINKPELWNDFQFRFIELIEERFNTESILVRNLINHNNNINNEQFDGLIRITSEMSKYLYPYIRAIVSSKDNYINKPELWNDFKSRYIELIEERFNTESVIVKNLLDYDRSQYFYKKILLTLSLVSSEEGYDRLRFLLANL